MPLNTTIFLHVGWTEKYVGGETPEGGHEYLKKNVGVEAENFRDFDGWCYGYAPVSRAKNNRGTGQIPIGGRTLNITKLGAAPKAASVDGITVVWTAKKPGGSPVIVGLYDRATLLRHMPTSGENRPFIAKARSSDCFLIPRKMRNFRIRQKEKGFPGMAAAYFCGAHQDGPAKEHLIDVLEHLPDIRRDEWCVSRTSG